MAVARARQRRSQSSRRLSSEGAPGSRTRRPADPFRPGLPHPPAPVSCRRGHDPVGAGVRRPHPDRPRSPARTVGSEARARRADEAGSEVGPVARASGLEVALAARAVVRRWRAGWRRRPRTRGRAAAPPPTEAPRGGRAGAARAPRRAAFPVRSRPRPTDPAPAEGEPEAPQARPSLAPQARPLRKGAGYRFRRRSETCRARARTKPAVLGGAPFAPDRQDRRSASWCPPPGARTRWTRQRTRRAE